MDTKLPLLLRNRDVKSRRSIPFAVINPHIPVKIEAIFGAAELIYLGGHVAFPGSPYFYPLGETTSIAPEIAPKAATVVKATATPAAKPKFPFQLKASSASTSSLPLWDPRLRRPSAVSGVSGVQAFSAVF